MTEHRLLVGKLIVSAEALQYAGDGTPPVPAEDKYAPSTLLLKFSDGSSAEIEPTYSHSGLDIEWKPGTANAEPPAAPNPAGGNEK